MQTITTNDGYIHSLDFIHGLPYLPLRPYTDKKWETLPQVILTSDVKWNPSTIDHKITNHDEWKNYYNDKAYTNNDNPFDIFGDYTQSSEANQHTILDINKTDIVINQHHLHHSQHGSTFKANVTLKPPKYNVSQPYLLYVDDETIKRTIYATTQYGCTESNAYQLRQTFKLTFPEMNVFKRNKGVATDTIYSNVSAMDNGSKHAKIYVGRKTLVIDVYPIKNEKLLVKTLQGNIRE